MLIIDLQNCQEIVAGDATRLRELLRPDPGGVKIRYSLAHATLKPGETSRPHTLKSSEVYYILEGEGVMHIENESARIHPGQAIYIPGSSRQSIENTGSSELRFLCIVDPAWRREDEEVF
jgi:mannose-6-phosphate isomerase-like protein (cupin superfamily)